MAAGSAWAQDADNAQELAKKLSNPVASLISVPFQENIDFGIGPQPDGNEGTKSTLNIQPVVPIGISTNWNLILRTILPVISQDDVTASGANQTGFGDTIQSFFFSPKSPGPGGLIWGVGPVGYYPSGTDGLSARKWGAGVTFVVLKQAGHATYGMLANQIWSVAGDSSRPDISSAFLQPFFSYTTPKATTFGINTETTYDWERQQWTVPINLTVSQLLKAGKQPIQVGVGARYYVEKPDGGPEWGLRLIITLLYPTK